MAVRRKNRSSPGQKGGRGTVCRRCTGLLQRLLCKSDSGFGRLKKEGLLEHLTEKIAIGQGYRGKTGELGVGLCTSGFVHCIKGCPADSEQIYEELRSYIISKMEK